MTIKVFIATPFYLWIYKLTSVIRAVKPACSTGRNPVIRLVMVEAQETEHLKGM